MIDCIKPVYFHAQPWPSLSSSVIFYVYIYILSTQFRLLLIYINCLPDQKTEKKDKFILCYCHQGASILKSSSVCILKWNFFALFVLCLNECDISPRIMNFVRLPRTSPTSLLPWRVSWKNYPWTRRRPLFSRPGNADFSEPRMAGCIIMRYRIKSLLFTK